MAFLEKREGSANEAQRAVIDLTNYKKGGIVALTESQRVSHWFDQWT